MDKASLRPFFTVVVATFNADKTIGRCLESLLAQTELAEIVVIDGASTDATVACVMPFVGQGRVRFLTEPDRGVFDAWNKGVDLSSGRWIIFIGGDDYYKDEEALRKLRFQLEQTPEEVVLAYPSINLVNSSGAFLRKENKAWSLCCSTLHSNMPFTHTGTAHRRSIFTERKFDPSYRVCGDYHFLFPLLSAQVPLFIPEYVVEMTDGGLSNDPKSRVRLIREILSVHFAYKTSVPLRVKIYLRAKLFYFKIRSLI